MRYFLAIYLFIFINTLSAQNLLFDVKTISVEDGLSSRTPNCIIEDLYGFVWVGTNFGLNRYDGYSVKTYHWEEKAQNNAVYQLYNDADSMLWIYCESKQINILHPLTGEIQTFESYFGKTALFNSKDIISIINSNLSNKSIYIKTKDGSYYQYEGQKKWKQCWNSHKVLESRIKYLYALDKNHIWLHEGDTCFLYNENNQLIRAHFIAQGIDILGISAKGQPILFQLKKDYVQLYLLTELGLELLTENIEISTIKGIDAKKNQEDRIYTISSAAHQLLWLRNEQYNYLFNTTIITPQLEYKNAISPKELSLELRNSFYKVSCSKDRILALSGDRVYIINLSQNRFQHFPKKITESLFSTRSIVMDTNDNIYIQNYTSSLFCKKTIESDSLISLNSIIHNANGCGLSSLLSRDGRTIWMGTENAKLIQYELSTKKVNYYESCGPQSQFSLWSFWSLFEDETGQIWVGSRDGIYLLDTIQECLVPYTKYNEFGILKESTITHFYANQKGLWVASSTGLYLLDKQKGIVARYHSNAAAPYNIPFSHIMFVHEGAEEEFWLATKGGGIINLNFKTNQSKQYTEADGLSDNRVHSIYEDDFNNLWMSSDYGLMQMNLETKVITTFLSKDGLPHVEFNANSHFNNNNGTLYFGGLKGVVLFNPKDFNTTKQTANTIPFVITACTKWDGDAEKELDILVNLIQTQSIHYYPSDIFLTIRFALLDYQDTKNHQYSYKIEGYMKDWIVSNENFIRLNGLPSGEYTLLIKGRTNLSTWQDNIIRVQLFIHAPFYKTGWFWSLALLLISSIVVVYYRWRINKFNSQKLLLETTIKERTQEIQKDKQTIEKQAEELQKIVELKAQFFANISHEIRTPLTLIISPIQQLLEHSILKKNSDKQEVKNLKIAFQNSKKLQRLVDEILLLSKLDAQKLDIQTQNIRLRPFLEQVYFSFETKAEAKSINYQFNCSIEADVVLEVDWRKLERVLYNLLSNAFKFTADNGQIQFEASFDEKKGLMIKVVDNGIGIHPNDLEHIFDRYYQSKQVDSFEYEGTGIGLALSKEFVELLGGGMNVKSDLGKETIFELMIPLVITTKEIQEIVYLQEEINTSDLIATTSLSLTKTMSILLVEDNIEVQNFVESLLLKKYNVFKASNGLEALDLLEQENAVIDLIISDIMMPKMDGFQFSKQLKNNPKWANIPVIILSAKAAQQDKLTALRIGVDDYIIKPFDAQELLVRIHNLLSNYQQRQQAKFEIVTNLLDPNAADITNQQESEFSWLEHVEEMAIDIIKKEQGNFNLPDFTEQLHLSERQFRRRINLLVGLSPNDYLRELKLKIARDYLEQNTYATVQDVAKSVGFGTATHFSKLYEDRFGKRPIEYFS